MNDTAINNSLVFTTAEPQWLEHLRDHGNSFEAWVVRATEGNHGTSQEADSDNLGKSFRFSTQ